MLRFCILCVSLSELLLGVVAPRSGSFSVCIYMYAMCIYCGTMYMCSTIQCCTLNQVSYSIKG